MRFRCLFKVMHLLLEFIRLRDSSSIFNDKCDEGHCALLTDIVQFVWIIAMVNGFAFGCDACALAVWYITCTFDYLIAYYGEQRERAFFSRFQHQSLRFCGIFLLNDDWNQNRWRKKEKKTMKITRKEVIICVKHFAHITNRQQQEL